MRVLHVLPLDIARGAQVYARALADRANLVPGEHHEIAVLFAGPRVAAFADHDLGVTAGWLHAAGMDPRAAWRLRRLVRRCRPDVVVAHGGESMKYVAFARSGRCPIVCHAIGVVSPRALSGASWVLYATLLRRADLVTAVSAAVAEQLRDVFKVAPDTVRVVANGRDPDAFVGAPRPAVGSRAELIFVGHLTPTKRPEVFIEVVSRLRARGSAINAVMVGEGPVHDDISAAADAAGVKLLGRRSDVPILLQEASVFLFTSRSEGEGMPGVIIEAGLAGMPVVATDVPGVRDVVIDGETGFVRGVDDIAGLTDAAERLIRDESLRSAMGQAARARCASLFSLDASTTMFIAELRGLVAQR